MGILLVLGVFVLAFLVGRLQVTVNRISKEHKELGEQVKKIGYVVEGLE